MTGSWQPKCSNNGVFVLYVIMRVMSPATWLSVWRRAVKLERMERRLLDWNHKGYAAEREPVK